MEYVYNIENDVMGTRR